MYVKGSRELDRETRIGYYHRAQEIAADNLPVIYTVLPERLGAVRNVFGNTTPAWMPCGTPVTSTAPTSKAKGRQLQFGKIPRWTITRYTLPICGSGTESAGVVGCSVAYYPVREDGNVAPRIGNPSVAGFRPPPDPSPAPPLSWVMTPIPDTRCSPASRGDRPVGSPGSSPAGAG
jgi:hypothetical protein